MTSASLAPSRSAGREPVGFRHLPAGIGSHADDDFDSGIAQVEGPRSALVAVPDHRRALAGESVKVCLGFAHDHCHAPTVPRSPLERMPVAPSLSAPPSRLPGPSSVSIVDRHGGRPRVIEASAPVRICDNGGWTDTWFGGPGRVLNIAVAPGVEVSIRPTSGPDPVVLDVQTFGDRYPIVPGAPRDARHPLLEAAIDSFPPPSDRAVEIAFVPRCRPVVARAPRRRWRLPWWVGWPGHAPKRWRCGPSPMPPIGSRWTSSASRAGSRTS